MAQVEKGRRLCGEQKAANYELWCIAVERGQHLRRFICWEQSSSGGFCEMKSVGSRRMRDMESRSMYPASDLVESRMRPSEAVS